MTVTIEVRIKTRLGVPWEDIVPEIHHVRRGQESEWLSSLMLIASLRANVFEGRWNSVGSQQGHYLTPAQIETEETV